jgi:hypothetical protein
MTCLNNKAGSIRLCCFAVFSESNIHQIFKARLPVAARQASFKASV